VGRDPDDITRVWAVGGGSITTAEGLRDAGVTHLTVSVGGDGHGYDLAPLRALVEWRDRQ
jgi:hypothetical protein